jgi:hypothetical protein
MSKVVFFHQYLSLSLVSKFNKSWQLYEYRGFIKSVYCAVGLYFLLPHILVSTLAEFKGLFHKFPLFVSCVPLSIGRIYRPNFREKGFFSRKLRALPPRQVTSNDEPKSQLVTVPPSLFSIAPSGSKFRYKLHKFSVR